MLPYNIWPQRKLTMDRAAEEKAEVKTVRRQHWRQMSAQRSTGEERLYSIQCVTPSGYPEWHRKSTSKPVSVSHLSLDTAAFWKLPHKTVSIPSQGFTLCPDSSHNIPLCHVSLYPTNSYTSSRSLGLLTSEHILNTMLFLPYVWHLVGTSVVIDEWMTVLSNTVLIP